MNLLLKKENILYESVMNKQNDRDSLSAFHDYVTFLSTEGISILAHLNSEVAERDKEEQEIQDLLKKIMEKIRIGTFKLEEIILKLKLEEDEILKERIQSLKNFLNGGVISIGVEPLESPNFNYNDILRRLDDLGHRNEISDYIVLSSSSVPDIKDAVAFEDKKNYYSLKNAFRKKHSRTTAEALVNLVKILANVNTPESTTEHKRSSYIADVEKVHNSIKLKYIKEASEKPVGDNVIFYIKNNEIYHYEIGKLEYRKRGLNDPKYIKALKNVIRYFPVFKNKMSVSEFKKKIHKNDIVDCDYRTTLGKSARSFNGFLKKNSVVNINPKNNKKVLDVTDAYITFHNSLK